MSISTPPQKPVGFGLGRDAEDVVGSAGKKVLLFYYSTKIGCNSMDTFMRFVKFVLPILEVCQNTLDNLIFVRGS